TTPLLQQADEQVRSHGVPAAASVFLHGDVWGGNMLWEGDRCVALIDWKTAGVGDPGVDLGSLRMQMALQYGQDAPAHVLEGWQRQAGRAAIAVPSRDAGRAPDRAAGSPGDGGRRRSARPPPPSRVRRADPRRATLRPLRRAAPRQGRRGRPGAKLAVKSEPDARLAPTSR